MGSGIAVKKPLQILASFICIATLGGLGLPALAGETPEITCTLSASQPAVAGGAVKVTFALQNRSDEGVYLLVWNTPLEGASGPNLLIQRQGITHSYRGPLQKRGDPGTEEYILLAPDKSASTTVDLASDYGISEAGRYHVGFQGSILDWTWQDDAVPRPRSEHRSLTISCDPIVITVNKG